MIVTRKTLCSYVSICWDLKMGRNTTSQDGGDTEGQKCPDGDLQMANDVSRESTTAKLGGSQCARRIKKDTVMRASSRVSRRSAS